MLQLRCTNVVGREAMVGLLVRQVESPIEEDLLAKLAWHLVAESGSRFCAIIKSPFTWSDPDNIELMSDPPVESPPFHNLQVRGVGIAAQVIAGKYRADFALQKLYVKQGQFDIGATLLIECDGYEFHNKHDWQVERDELRDSEIMKQFDCSILRLKGHEIHADPQACAGRALDMLDDLAVDGAVNHRVCGMGDQSEDGAAYEGEDEQLD
jgi:very-short-patch-repair endonuclease